MSLKRREGRSGRKHSLPSLFPSLSDARMAMCFGDFLAEPPGELRSEVREDDLDYVIGQRMAAVALRNSSLLNPTVSGKAVRRLAQAAFDSLQRSVALVATSQDALEQLNVAGIPFAVSKGPGITSRCHAIAERPFSDLDVLVRPRDFGSAYLLLHGLGYEEREESGQPWRYFNRHCREAINLYSPSGGSVDLHHRVPPWQWSKGLKVADLQSAATPIVFAGVTLPVVTTEHNLLISALHVVSDRNRPGAMLMSWRDVLLLADLCEPSAVRSVAERHGLATWLRWTLSQLPETLRPSRLCIELGEGRIVPHNARRLRGVTRPGDDSARLVQYALRLPTPNALAYVAGMVVPAPSFLHRKYPTTALPYWRWWESCLTKWCHGHRGVDQGDETETPEPTGQLRSVALESIRPFARRGYYDIVVHLARAKARVGRGRAGGDWTTMRPPAFIIGSGRSGTTLLAELLGSHPEVQCLVEPYGRWAGVDPRTDFLGVYTSGPSYAIMRDDLVDDRVRQRFRAVFAPSRGRLLVEKSPINSLRLAYLLALAPGSRFVHIVRDGFAVADSAAKVAANSVELPGRGVFNRWWGVDDRKWALLCRDADRAGFGAPRLPEAMDDEQRAAFEWIVSLEEIRHYEEALGDRLLTIRYEDLGNDSANALREVAAHLGVTADEDWLRRCVGRVRSPRESVEPQLLLPGDLTGRFFAVARHFNVDKPQTSGPQAATSSDIGPQAGAR